MDHDIILEGYSLRLRPVALSDAQFVVEIRTDPRLNKFIHPISGDIDEQIIWLEKYMQRVGDYYFIVENARGLKLGTIGLYGVKGGNAEWGRWIMRPPSNAAVESAWLIYRVAFDIMRLDSVCCYTLAENESVVSFHDSCGLKKIGLIDGHFQFGEEKKSAIKHELDAVAWPSVATRLDSLACAISRRQRD